MRQAGWPKRTPSPLTGSLAAAPAVGYNQRQRVSPALSLAKADPVSYRALDPQRIIDTIETLSRRIEERFAGSGLGCVCRELLDVARQAKRRAARIARRNWALRLVAALVIAGIVGGTVAVFVSLKAPKEEVRVTDLIQYLDAGFNDLVLIGAAVFFLVTLETRVKRRRALAAIHELRAMVHVIDMHQLTKDPERALQLRRDTPSSPKETLTPFELNRYLDYCTEMLSLAGKIAAVYVQDFDDGVALASANEVETLATGLSRKIWQKIMILHGLEERQAQAAEGISRVAPDSSIQPEK